jgi:predicted polyphosphate/ATP-dependent NAD kinase
MKLGVIINPIAGIGGRVGLKGSDGAETQKKALELGASPESGKKAGVALDTLMRTAADEVEILTWADKMGEDVVREYARDYKLEYKIVGRADPCGTTADDTVKAAKAMKKAGAEMILFAGGDGTARNILDAVGTDLPVLGIPAGCKIHSAVYALNPKSAGEITARFAKGQLKKTKESEVMDIDEALFRENIVEARLYGYLRVPDASGRMQNLKSGRGTSEAASVQQLANYIADTIEKDTLYIVAGGSTTQEIMKVIGLKNTLLGVDLFMNKKVLKNDVTEREILDALDECPKAKILVTVIGGQGYLFGRGNQQISAEVLRRVGKDGVIIAASKGKMISLIGRSLYVDVGDEDVNKSMSGYYKVVTGYDDFSVFKAEG